MIEQQVSPVRKVGKAVWSVMVHADALMMGVASSIDEIGENVAKYEAYEAGVEGKLPERVVMAMAFREALHGTPNCIEEAFKEGAIVRAEGQLEIQRTEVMQQLAERDQQIKASLQEQADNAASFFAVTLIGAGLAGAGMILDIVAERANMGNKTKTLAQLMASGLTNGGTALAFGGAVESVASGVDYVGTSINGIENAMRAKALSTLDLKDKARQLVTEKFAR